MTISRGAKQFFTPREAAKVAGCSEAYLYDRARKGAFTSKQVAGRVQIDCTSFLAWLEGYQIRRHRQPENKTEATQIFA